jgi:hypothetical protein
MTWQRAVWAGAIASAPIFVGVAGAREWPAAGGSPASGPADRPAPAVAEVAGVVTLAGDGRVQDAVVYLEPLDLPRPAPAAAARPEPLPSPAVAAAPAPRDSTRLLWGAVRELGLVARDLRDRVAALRTGNPARVDAAAPRTPMLAALDSAAAPAAPPPRAEPARVAEAAPPAPPRAEPSRADIVMRQKTFLPHVQVVGAAAWWSGPTATRSATTSSATRPAAPSTSASTRAARAAARRSGARACTRCSATSTRA